LISYRDPEKDVPGPYSFYHSIVYVPGVDGGVWLDPTCSFCPPGHIPLGEQGLNSIILFDGKTGFTPTLTLPVEKAARVFISEADTLQPDASATGRSIIRYYGDTAYMYDELIEDKGLDSIIESMEEQLDDSMSAKWGDVTIEGLELEVEDGLMEMNLPYAVSRYASKSGDKLVLSYGGDSEGLGVSRRWWLRMRDGFPYGLTRRLWWRLTDRLRSQTVTAWRSP
jgi:hypothetical protein